MKTKKQVKSKLKKLKLKCKRQKEKCRMLSGAEDVDMFPEEFYELAKLTAKIKMLAWSLRD